MLDYLNFMCYVTHLRIRKARREEGGGELVHAHFQVYLD